MGNPDEHPLGDEASAHAQESVAAAVDPSPVYHEEPPVDVPGHKGLYLAQRVQLSDQYDTTLFHDDLKGRPAGFVGFHVWGPCPSCGHPTAALLATKYLREYAGDPLEAATAAHGGVKTIRVEERPPEPRHRRPACREQVLWMKCDCTHTHSLTAPKAGCGSEWLLLVEFSPEHSDTDVVISPVGADAAPLYWEAAKTVASSSASSLATAEAAATKWISVFSAALAILTLAGIVAGRSTIVSLPVIARAVLGIALAVAIVGNILMLWFGNLAGLGFPSVQAARNSQALADADVQPLLDAEGSTARLDNALKAAIASGAAAAVAIAIFLFVPATAASNAGLFKITLTVNGQTTTTACGTLVPGAKQAKYTFTPPGGTTGVYPAADVSDITAC